MNRSWTVDEVRILAEIAYFPALRAELSERMITKAVLLRQAEDHLPGRTHHTLKDRCYRISEVLRDEGYPCVRGWKPPALVGQSPNSAGVTAIIRDAVLPIARRELDL